MTKDQDLEVVPECGTSVRITVQAPCYGKENKSIVGHGKDGCYRYIGLDSSVDTVFCSWNIRLINSNSDKHACGHNGQPQA
jgi:hypothetical protein